MRLWHSSEPLVGDAITASISSRAVRVDRQTRHVEEIKHVQVFQLVWRRGPTRRGSHGACGGLCPRLPGDEKVEIVGATACVGKYFDGARRPCSFAIHRGRRIAFAFGKLVEHSLKQRCVTICNVPIHTELAESVDEEVDVVIDLVIDGGRVDEEDTSSDPDGEGERRTEFVEHGCIFNMRAQSRYGSDGGEAILNGTERW